MNKCLMDNYPIMYRMAANKGSWVADNYKKNRGVDIGDEMLESSFPHVEIEKDDGGGQGQAAGHGNENANSSSNVP